MYRIPIIIGLVIVMVLAAGAGTAWAVFVGRSENSVVRGVANVFPIPAGKVGSRTVLYRDYLESKDALATFLESEAAKEGKLDVPLDTNIERNVLEKLLHQKALEELAEQKNIAVSDAELRVFFADVIAAASTTTPDVGVYLLKNFGWTEEDFRQNVLRPALLEQRLALELSKENQGDPNALGIYMEGRMQKKDVVRYLRF